MAVTIKDVAKHAGVSVATISRYLNNSPFIAQATAERVRFSMAELKYYPNSIARSFVNQTTNTVAFVVDSQNSDFFGNPYFLQIQYGIEKVLGSRGYYLMIVHAGSSAYGESILSKLISEKRVDGIILPSILAKKSIINNINDRNFPCVVFGNQKKDVNVSWVDLDNVMGGEIATDYLIETGCKNIAFICHSKKKVFGAERLEGYRKALGLRGFKFGKELVFEGFEGMEKGYELIMDLIAQKKLPDGLIFSDNVAAFGAITALKDNDVKIPEDVQIISFDNSLPSTLSRPMMSVIEIDMFDLGLQAATMLLKQLETPTYNKQQSMISVKLIKRGTSKIINEKR